MQPPGPGRTFFVVVVVFVIVVGDLAATSFRALPTDRRCSALPHTTVNGRATFQPHHPASFATITRAVRRFARHHLAPPSLVVTPRNRRHPSSWNGVSIFLASRPPSPLLFPFSSPLSSLCLSLSLSLYLSLSLLVSSLLDISRSRASKRLLNYRPRLTELINGRRRRVRRDERVADAASRAAEVTATAAENLRYVHPSFFLFSRLRY